MIDQYAELQCHTNYSFLQGASHPHELLTQAHDLNLTALAITDHLGVYGLPKAYMAWKDHELAHKRDLQKSPPPQLICGSRIPMDMGPDVTLLAKNHAGYALMTQILTRAHAHGAKGEASISWPQLLEELGRQSSPHLFILVSPQEDFCSYTPLMDLCPQHVYLTLHRHLSPQDTTQFLLAKELQKRYQLPMVATNDVYYHHPDRRHLQDVLTCIHHNTTLKEAGHRLYPNGERYLKSPQQMKHLFRDYPQAIYNTLEIANACHFSLSELRYRYPSEWLPPGLNSQEFLNDLVKKGTQWRYPKGPPEAVLKQIKHELQLVEQLNFADYFITIWDIVQFARKRKILCQGRGSAANSVICYCLGITAIDPVQMNLLFERFISAERNEPPDIDVDFEHERREEVIQYIYKKYGRHKAAMVSAVITFRRRSILRELSKVFALPLEGSLEERLKKSETSPALSQQIQKISREIKGFPRHLSIHSGGFTLSADPIIEIVPVEPARMSDRTIIQWDKYDLDILQLLKVDILALGMLSAIKKTLSYLGDKDSLASIPPADPQTYKMIQKAQTIGTFQIESRAQMNMLGRLQPRCFYDLVIQVAIVRPGPIVGQMVHPYLRRRRGLESPHTPNPILNKILGRTLGVPLFQEQIMKIAIELADFSPGEADQLRRAIGAWTSDGNIQDVGQRLSTGLLRSGLPAPYVQQIFEHIKGFAEYGFPESHAASFALIAYVSAYLKCHHPAEFTCGLLNSQPMGFYSPSTLVEEVRRQGVEVLPIDPNHSLWDCTLEGRKIRLGWRYIKGFPKKLAQRILEVRQERSFSSLHDFVQRSEVPKYLLERLALGDVFASFGATQRHSFWQILALQLQSRHLNSKEQLSFFETVSSIEHEPAPQLENLPLFDAIAQERQLFGISCKGHPLKALRQILTLPATTSFSLKQVPHNQWVTTCGLVITRQRPSTAKGVIFATLEDEFGFVDLIFRPEIVQNHEEAFYQNIFLEVKGRLQRDRESCSILVRSLRPLLLDHQK